MSAIKISPPKTPSLNSNISAVPVYSTLNIDLCNPLSNVGGDVLCTLITTDRGRSALSESLHEVVDDVVDVLNSDGYTDEILCDTGCELLFFRELFVSGGGGMDDQGPVVAGLARCTDSSKMAISNLLRVTDVGEVRGELEVIYKSSASLFPTSYTERENTSEPTFEVLLRNLMARMALEPWVAHPRNFIVFL